MNAPQEPLPHTRPVAVRALLDAPPVRENEAAFFFDCLDLPGDPAFIEGIVLRRGSLQQARHLLAAGAPRVYLGEAALLDSGIVEKLAAEFGGERVGVHVPARRMHVSWTLDIDSNADFRVMTPSVCEPCWEVLRADGTRSGTHAGWWLGVMFSLGAGAALVQADITDNADLNILAGLTERWDDRLWLAPLADPAPDFAAWVELGGARQLAAPAAMLQNDSCLAALGIVPDSGLPNEETG